MRGPKLGPSRFNADSLCSTIYSRNACRRYATKESEPGAVRPRDRARGHARGLRRSALVPQRCRADRLRLRTSRGVEVQSPRQGKAELGACDYQAGSRRARQRRQARRKALRRSAVDKLRLGTSRRGQDRDSRRGKGGNGGALLPNPPRGACERDARLGGRVERATFGRSPLKDALKKPGPEARGKGMSKWERAAPGRREGVVR